MRGVLALSIQAREDGPTRMLDLQGLRWLIKSLIGPADGCGKHFHKHETGMKGFWQS